MKPLTRKEFNRIKGAENKFNRFMGSRRYKGGVNNLAACRLFLLYLDNGSKLPTQCDQPMVVGDVSRHGSVRCLFLGGLVSTDHINGNGKFYNQETYDHGYKKGELDELAANKKAMLNQEGV